MRFKISPYDVPNPHDTDPPTRDGVDVREAPVTEAGNLKVMTKQSQQHEHDLMEERHSEQILVLTMEEMSWARQKASMRATEGRSIQDHPCDRVTKMRACEMMATVRDGRRGSR